MDYIRGTGTFTVTINGSVSKFDGDCTLNVTKTGSNAVAEVKNIATGSWQPLTTASLSDIRYMYFANESTASIVVANNSTGTSVLTTLYPNDSTIIAWSGAIGACPLYASCKDAGSSSVLYYILTEE